MRSRVKNSLLRNMGACISGSKMLFTLNPEHIYAAFTLNGFNDEKRNLTFVKTDFQVLIVKFYTCNFNRLFLFFINYILRDLDNTKNTFIQDFCWVTSCQTCMCKRGIIRGSPPVSHL